MNHVHGRTLDTGAVAASLQSSILESTDVNGFLVELVSNAAKNLAYDGKTASCGITLISGRRMVSVASSDTLARYMDETQHKVGAGPCLEAARTRMPMNIADIATETRWNVYLDAVRGSGIRSIFSIPFDVDGDAAGALNLYATVPGAFSGQVTERAHRYAHQASVSLRLAMLIADLTDSKQDIVQAIQSRTNITLALGIIMAQRRFSQEDAFALLQQSADGLDVGIPDAAERIIASVRDARDPA
ncbi:MAG: GAF and ANTAR domain-containing protein [Arthrobacter sp.]|uniref:GAF domain-containing protein n=1 Tax=Arthrobacter sp. TaxID=1667 RepID=UPI003497FFA9